MVSFADLRAAVARYRHGNPATTSHRSPIPHAPRLAVLLLPALLAAAASAAAGQQAGRERPDPAGGSGLGIGLLATLDGPAPPDPPAVLARDEQGRVTARAVRLDTPLELDGRLDEALYARVPPLTGFIQNDPVEGAPASERTEVWIFFDDEQVYLSARCWESRPERMRATEMRRDNTNIAQDDNLAWAFDTFYDRRNGMLFEVNAAGGRMDGQMTNEGRTNFDWNPLWRVEVGRFDGGWTVETAMPFKSLRYRPGPAQLWGFNLRRRVRWKNELAYLRPVPAALGPRGLRPSLLAPLVGIEAPPGSRNLEVKPFAIADLTTDTAATPPLRNAAAGAAGIDLKYGLTQNLTADFTVNTDFAQVEADEQQVNLTRFRLFFPEKREFFLENRGTFEFGGEGGDTPILFHSRQIGLQAGRAIPVHAGARLTGRVGDFDVGLVQMRTGSEDVSGARVTDFSVVRVKRDILRASSIGVLMTRRSVSLRGPGDSGTYGIDGGFSFLGNLLVVDTYWARTATPGVVGSESSWRANIEYDGDRYGFQAERLVIGDEFRPEVGFVRRRDMERSLARARFSPRLLSVPAIRKLSWSAGIDYIENLRGVLETREGDAEFGVEFENSDRLTVGYARTYERLLEPFDITPDISIPPGGYGFETYSAELVLGPQRVASGRVRLDHGAFFSGRKTELAVTRGRMQLTRRVSTEPTYAYSLVNLREGRFTTHLAGARLTFTVTPLMFTSALIQYNTSNSTAAANVRFRWEYQPGSELFVVYNEQRSDPLSVPRLEPIRNRAVVVKLTRLFRF